MCSCKIVPYLLSFFIPFIIGLLLTPFIIKYATIKKIALVKIDERKLHREPLPQVGGIVVFLSFLITTIIFIPMNKLLIGILICSFLILTIGITDDILELNPYIKLLLQIIIAIILILFGIKITHITNPIKGMVYIGIYGIILSIIWIVGIINALNFIDGLDGLACGIAFISSIIFFIVLLLQNKLDSICTLFTLSLAGATLGFLPYNFYPAKVFLGDNGSYFIGLILACISILGGLKSITVLSFATPILILGIPILDTTSSIIRRIVKGRSPFNPDKEHIHHRLLQLGLTHRQVVILIYIVSIILGSMAIMLIK